MISFQIIETDLAGRKRVENIFVADRKDRPTNFKANIINSGAIGVTLDHDIALITCAGMEMRGMTGLLIPKNLRMDLVRCLLHSLIENQ